MAWVCWKLNGSDIEAMEMEWSYRKDATEISRETDRTKFHTRHPAEVLRERGFRPIELFDNRIIMEKVNHVHQNAVESYLVQYPEHWMFSSARNYAGLDGLLYVSIIE